MLHCECLRLVLCSTGGVMYQYFVKIVPTVYKNISGSVSTHTHMH